MNDVPPEPSTDGHLRKMVSYCAPLTLFAVTAAVCVRLALLPVDVQAGSIILIAFAWLGVAIWSLDRAIDLARLSPDGVTRLFLALLIQICISVVLCTSVFLIGR